MAKSSTVYPTDVDPAQFEHEDPAFDGCAPQKEVKPEPAPNGDYTTQ